MALNYNALLHFKILVPKTDNCNQEEPLNKLSSSVVPEELNISEGLASTVVDRIVVHKNKEASGHCVDATGDRGKERSLQN